MNVCLLQPEHLRGATRTGVAQFKVQYSSPSGESALFLGMAAAEGKGTGSSVARPNRWDRVGEERHAQNALRGPMALAEARKDFASKFWDKTRNKWEASEQFATFIGKYTLIERDYGVDDSAAEAPSAANALVESKLDPRVQDFVRLTFG
ncbi:hypothetical protein AB1Y20_015411 [Prymnesium parvum]|uniref:NAD(+) ADP-ribosyltransferase n=1 Tax=Prymnesium parvum TaxID=97485 RepID=A0AB34K0T4_PRYPA